MFNVPTVITVGNCLFSTVITVGNVLFPTIITVGNFCFPTVIIVGIDYFPTVITVRVITVRIKKHKCTQFGIIESYFIQHLIVSSHIISFNYTN